jgi:acid stress-induced BolA-like protein IbaG/YrbA
MNAKLLEDALRGVPLRDVKVRVEGRPGHWVAEVISPDFAAQEESERQRTVWEQLQRELSDEQCVQVEFVFTFAPGEDGADTAK